MAKVGDQMGDSDIYSELDSERIPLWFGESARRKGVLPTEIVVLVAASPKTV